MNVRRWSEEKDPERLMLKLCEECGEVAKAILGRNSTLALEELEHVDLLRRRLREVISLGPKGW